MPLSGLPSFPQAFVDNGWNYYIGLNALIRATFISTVRKELDIRDSELSQCPYPGYLHFHGQVWETAETEAFRASF